jgi:hypothetical protein
LIGVELPAGDQSAVHGQGAQAPLVLGLEPGRVVDEVPPAVGDAAFGAVDAHDAVGEHDVPVQVRVQRPGVGLDADGGGVPVAVDEFGALAVALVPGAGVADSAHQSHP